ncbi:MAG TPA: peptide chain release factor 2, partial [Ruminococcaceae bacterium]|nr:peptide chain release factor 2 [Oscillospiraceae bacterium]
MLQFEELKQSLQGFKPELNDLADTLDLDAIRKEIMELDQKTTVPNFWDDAEKSQRILQRSSSLKNKIERYEKLKSGYDDLMALIELADEEGDLSLLPQAQQELESFKKGLESQRLSTLL